jgi:hypothetical protein
MEWISVEDDVPMALEDEKGLGYLIPVLAFDGRSVSAIFWDVDDQCFWEGGLPVRDITYWMHFPDPPRHAVGA